MLRFFGSCLGPTSSSQQDNEGPAEIDLFLMGSHLRRHLLNSVTHVIKLPPEADILLRPVRDRSCWTSDTIKRLTLLFMISMYDDLHGCFNWKGLEACLAEDCRERRGVGTIIGDFAVIERSRKVAGSGLGRN